MTKPVFARHETFHPRYNWLKKGFDAAVEDPEIFIRKDAHVVLGVGKNMVRSIRYWCHAFKVLEEDPDAGGRRKPSQPTDFGEYLLGPDGVDPYLEDLGSLWLLHWRLLQNPCEATAWRYAFFGHTKPEVSREELTSALRDYLEREFPDKRVARSSLKKDASCIVRMYGEVPTGAAVSEDSIHCPFAELELLRPAARAKAYRFRMGWKPGLTAELVVAVCLEYAADVAGGSNTIAVSKLLHGAGSPGLAFKLTETALYGALESVTLDDPVLDLSDTAGVVQLSYSDRPAKCAEDYIGRHYEVSVRKEAVA